MKQTALTRWLGPLVVFGLGFGLYASTLAPSVVFGDPSEYTLVPHVFGVVHPPGYAFMTVLVRLWQTVVPIGSVAYRTNLLAAVTGALTAMLVFISVRSLAALPEATLPGKQVARWLVSAFAAASLLVAPDVWQHSIHTNSHVVTMALAVLALTLLLQWRASNDDRWLLVFSLVAGVSVTHHPLTVFGFPAFTAFIIAVRPRVLTHWRTLLAMVGFGVLGLFSWLYFPIVSAVGTPPFGPDDLHTLDGFLNLVLARGLTVNLFHFGLADQWHRLIVLASLVQLQYALPVLGLAAIGLVWLALRDWRAGLLLGVHLLVNLVFTMNSVQDVMAYLLVPFATIAVLAGVGAWALARWLLETAHSRSLAFDAVSALAALLLVWPGLKLIGQYDDISLRDETRADDYVDALVAHFGDRGEHAVLLSDWEHMTPLWYRQYLEGLKIDPSDVTPVYVVGSSPTLWVDRIWEYIDQGPIYLIEYRRDVIDTGFRLRAEGSFYRVVPPPATAMPDIAEPREEQAGPLTWLGYEIQHEGPVRPGERVPIVLFFRLDEPTVDIVHPYTVLGDWRFEWTTDSHLLTPWWAPGEIMAERWEIIVPLTAEPGRYPLEMGLRNLSAGGADLLWSDGEARISLGELEVAGEPLGNLQRPELLSANFGQRVGVQQVRAWAPGWEAVAPWPEPQVVQPGDTIEVRVTWHALAPPEDSLTVFLHLLDYGNTLHASHDYTPLGGAFPTQLWFPKWLPGQRTIDPYRITVPDTLPPGDYYLQLGLYGLRSIVRVPNIDPTGSLSGDRFVLGGIRVAP